MRVPDPDDLVGLRLPGGTSRVEGYENLLLHDAVRSPRSPHPHPIWAFLAPQRGMGLTLAALFETLGCPLDAGPLLGRFGARWAAPFALDVDHVVRGGVTAVRRRHGRVLGPVDEVDVVLDLGRGDGTPVLTATYGFLLPRPGAAPGVPAAHRPARVPRGLGTVGEPITVRAEEMKLLALLLRDPNPVHIDAAAAASQGHRACVNQGPANLAYVLTFLTERLADRLPTRRTVAFHARFRATVVDGDVVAPVVHEVRGGPPDTVDVALRLADGRVALSGQAELGA